MKTAIKKTGVSRRSFLKASALAGGGLMLSFYAPVAGATDLLAEDAVFEPNGFIKILSDGQVILMSPNPECGQGIKTALPILVGEELDVNWETVVVEQAGFDSSKYSRQIAGGSGAIRASWDSFRKAGAIGRKMLIEAAAKSWNASASDCYTEKGFVIHRPSGRKVEYGKIAAQAASIAVPTDVELKNPSDYKLIGQRIAGVDNKKIFTGKMEYGIDTRREGMLFAMVARPPAFGKKVKSYDDTAAKAVDGVKQVVALDKDAVAVLATTTWAAKKGRDALKIEWEIETPLESSEQHKAMMEKSIMEPGQTRRSDGDVVKALEEADKVIEVVFEAPFLPHAPLEPMNFFADVRDDRAELYGPTQNPGSIPGAVARLTGLSPDKITVGMSRMGGGFGRRLNADFAVEAARVSKAAKSPVLVVWTREDDMQGGIYRPNALYRYRATIKDGKFTGWYCIAAGISTANPTRENCFPAGAVPNFRVDTHEHKSNITTGPWRAPNHNFIAFSEQSMLDEIAHALGKDPVAFRLELLEQARTNPAGRQEYNIDRFKNVIEECARRGEWGKKKGDGIYQGFSAHFSFNTYVAHVVDLSVTSDKIKIHKVTTVVDCGRVINRSGSENMIEGGVIDGIGHALYGEFSIKDGVVQQNNFHQHKLIRINDAPLVQEIHFINNDEIPTGLGEPGMPPICGAVANAVFAATGKRMKRMPFGENLAALAG